MQSSLFGVNRWRGGTEGDHNWRLHPSHWPGGNGGDQGKWGYSTPINDINKAGGIYLSQYGKKLPVRLILYDDQVDPAKTAANIERLILKDNVHALLGSAGPEAVIAAGTLLCARAYR